MSFRLSTVHAFIAVDEEGEDGIIGMMMPNGQWMPFVAGDETRLKELKELAKIVAEKSKVQVKLVKFSNRENVEMLIPGGEWMTITGTDRNE